MVAERSRSRRAALARDPKNGPLRGDLIRVEAEINGIWGALAKARDLAKDDPGNSIYDIVSAELYLKAGRKDEAAGLLEKALTVHPNDNKLIIALSQIYDHAGDPAKAEAILPAPRNPMRKEFAMRSA